MSTLQFAKAPNLVAYFAKPTKSDGFEQIVDFLNAHPIRYALTVNPIIYVSHIKRFWTTAKSKTVNEEGDKIKKYVRGLPDMIHGSVVASKPKIMQEAIEIATELMDKKVRTFAERETASKRKLENTSRTTRNQQQQQQHHSNKRQNTGRVYTTASGGKKQYGGSKPLCTK
nr:hypothetical protein [Tanacetum cinerariifolium]